MSSPRVGSVVLGALVVFWLGLFITAGLADGYSSGQDYISSLASRGSSVWPLGELVLLVFATAHVAAAVLVRLIWSSRVLAPILLFAGGAVVAIATFRSSCPGGEAGCDLGPAVTTDDWVESAHGMSAGVYALLMVVAMAVTASGLRGRRGWPAWLALLSVPIAVVSVLCSGGADGGPDTGVWQRAWLAANSAWLAAVVLATRMRPQPRR